MPLLNVFLLSLNEGLLWGFSVVYLGLKSAHLPKVRFTLETSRLRPLQTQLTAPITHVPMLRLTRTAWFINSFRTLHPLQVVLQTIFRKNSFFWWSIYFSLNLREGIFLFFWCIARHKRIMGMPPWLAKIYFVFDWLLHIQDLSNIRLALVPIKFMKHLLVNEVVGRLAIGFFISVNCFLIYGLERLSWQLLKSHMNTTWWDFTSFVSISLHNLERVLLVTAHLFCKA